MRVNDERGREFLWEVGMLCCSARVLLVMSAMFSRLRQHAKKVLITSLTNAFGRGIFEEWRLCWLLGASVRVMDGLIASLLLCFDNRDAHWSEVFPLWQSSPA
jgi:hypothetical protein